jgi:hypothetical protein
MPVPYHTDWSWREHEQPAKVQLSPPFCCQRIRKSHAISIHVFLQIRQTYWCLCLIDIWHKSLQLMKDIEKPHMDKYKQISNNWNYDSSCTLTSLPVSSTWFLLHRGYICTHCSTCSSHDSVLRGQGTKFWKTYLHFRMNWLQMSIHLLYITKN